MKLNFNGLLSDTVNYSTINANHLYESKVFKLYVGEKR